MATAAHSAAQRQATPRFTLTESRAPGVFFGARAIRVSAQNQKGSERRAERSCVTVLFNGN